MKQTRLLEIIREEISGALNEAGLGDQITVLDKQIETVTKQISPLQKKISDLQKKKADLQKKEADLSTKTQIQLEEGEKRKKLAEKYQLDEETINEMASVVQTKKALEKLGDETGLELVKDVEKETLDQFKNSNPSTTSDGRLIRKLSPEEQKGKKDTRGYGADFERNFKKKAGMDFMDFTTDISLKWTEKFPGDKPFNAGLATNTTEKDAAFQVLDLEKGKQGRKADPNKPEKPASTGKKGRPAGEPKAEKTATLTPGDDGFDDVSYSDAGVDDEGNKVEIDTTVKTVTGDKEIEAKLKDVISKKKDKLKAALKSKDQETYNKEKAALKQFLEKPEIAKYIKKKTVDKVNPYTLSSIEDDIK